ncbi:MAG: 2-oxoglutarate dehydrogenase complex dihydrolipoyllysine-residue succinyltransferase [Planctomycetota bacterium]|nr:2-oxoglutarate dehydrogenase complex dihydrolipoyllysine-residue succinyltransferase [Planctomycetota bacterium]
MPVEIVIPSLGESIREIRLGQWLKQDGDWVNQDDSLVEIESDKVTQELPSPGSGVLHITEKEGADLPIGANIGSIDTEAAAPETTATAPETPAPAAAAPPEQAPEASAPPPTAPPATRVEIATESAAASTPVRATSMAKKIAEDRGVPLSGIQGSGPQGRIMKADVLSAPTGSDTPSAIAADDSSGEPAPLADARGIRRKRLSKLRMRIAERLVSAQHNAAMLTTFNEADMSAVMEMRSLHKDEFNDQYGVKLGFMSFFARACVSALHHVPAINAFIDGDELEFHDYVDLAVAVGTDRGLVVPVVRNADRKSFAEIESDIAALAAKARAGQLSVDEMTGGTFTISNGGVYGSMMSTPILNPPQSGILGLHRIQKRPMEDPDNPGQIVLRPMMYLALSYDHRVVDGSEAVGFLVHVKQCIEDPERLLLGL